MLMALGQQVGPQLPWGITSFEWSTLSPQQQTEVLQTAGQEQQQAAYNVLLSSGVFPSTSPAKTSQFIAGISNTTLVVGAGIFLFLLMILKAR